MDLNQIEETLKKRFNRTLEDYEVRRIIFWQDQKGEFKDDWNTLELENVKFEELKLNNQFSVKYLLESTDTTSTYLIYTNLDLNSPKNWLLDTVLYSDVFTARRVDILMDELQIDSSLKSVMEDYEAFFEVKSYFQKFKKYGKTEYNKEKIETRIISVLCDLSVPNYEQALRNILMDTLDDVGNRYLKLIKDYFSIDRFWEIIKNKFDYTRDPKSLKTLFMHLSITSLSISMDVNRLDRIRNFIANRNQNDCYVFIDHWMNHKDDIKVFEKYVKEVEAELDLRTLITNMEVRHYKDTEIFPIIDRAIIDYIANSVLGDLESYEEYLNLIDLRRTKHFYKKYESIYNVLYYAIQIVRFKNQYTHGIPKDNALNMFKDYYTSYYQMDSYYRKFYLAYDTSKKYEFINKLQEKIEYIYTNWYLGGLSAHWSQAVRENLANNWKISGIKKQQDFYRTNVLERLKNGERIFVIISDAMRYEIGVSLSERIEQETLGEIKIEPMLGVVPSITKLGMAALLPHQTLTIDDTGYVMIDGQRIEGYIARKNYIQSKVDDSIVVKHDDFSNMNLTNKRELFKGKKLIYIYHDKLDSIGDNSPSENQIFKAAEDTLDDLMNTINSIRNELSGTNIFITADHGFLYQRNPLVESDKIASGLDKPIESKKRYTLSRKRQDVDGQIHLGLSEILSIESDLNVYVPNGAIRNRIQGPGSNFVHGGASLQEIVVPLIFYKNKRPHQKNVTQFEKVKVEYTSQTKRITNKLFSLRFFQNERVMDKRIPVTVEVYFEDYKGNIISNVETIIADKSTNNPSEREFIMNFALETMQFDKSKNYYLIIKDIETDQITSKIPFEISLGISTDFDFF